VKARYFDPERQAMVETQVQVANLRPLVGAILSLSSERGHPALEIFNDDGSSLVIGTDGRGAVVGWMDSLGQSFHSSGDLRDVPPLVFDYHGTWTEAPAETQVRWANALDCAEGFVRLGTPDSEAILFVPD
jgi:Immunity protein Imm1